eukprot:365055-Chlamydomonas_euryale.AAC.6
MQCTNLPLLRPPSRLPRGWCPRPSQPPPLLPGLCASLLLACARVCPPPCIDAAACCRRRLRDGRAHGSDAQDSAVGSAEGSAFQETEPRTARTPKPARERRGRHAGEDNSPGLRGTVDVSVTQCCSLAKFVYKVDQVRSARCAEPRADQQQATRSGSTCRILRRPSGRRHKLVSARAPVAVRLTAASLAAADPVPLLQEIPLHTFTTSHSATVEPIIVQNPPRA